MSGVLRSAACAAAITVVLHSPAGAEADASPAAFNQTMANLTEAAGTTGSVAIAPGREPRGGKGSGQGRLAVSSGPAGSILKQIPSVSIACFKPDLVRIIRSASTHFGSAAIITSGFRPGRRSYHGKCMAADVQIAGVSPGRLAAYFRAQDGVGGVGTYRHTRSVHVDVAGREFSWHGGRRRVASLWRDY
jgi:Peptidase M15